MINDWDGWDAVELTIAEAYATTCNGVLQHIVEQLRQTEIQLPPDKLAVVELTALLETAARLGRDHLGLSGTDFATAAADVYQRSTPQ